MFSLRWWNSFTILAAILIAIGVIGALSGGRMVFDPGRVSSGKEWILYLLAGALMLINGLLPPATTPRDEDAVPAARAAPPPPNPDASASSDV